MGVLGDPTELSFTIRTPLVIVRLSPSLFLLYFILLEIREFATYLLVAKQFRELVGTQCVSYSADVSSTLLHSLLIITPKEV